MAKLEIDVPDDFVLREGVVVLSGWRMDEGEPRMMILPLEDAPIWVQSGLLDQALRRSHIRMQRSWD